MVARRGVLPLLLTGTSGLALLAFGLGGLSDMDPRIEQAARTVQFAKSPPDRVHRLADCPPVPERVPRAPEV